VVRAAAASAIPLVSAVGHETDTTLLDHVADRRAPTPTAAAEIVVPVWADLLRNVSELGSRQRACMLKTIEHRRMTLRSATRALPTPDGLLGPQRQRVDLAGAKLKPALARLARLHETNLARLAHSLIRHSPVAVLREARARLRAWGGDRPLNALRRQIELKHERFPRIALRSSQLLAMESERREQKLKALGQLLESYSYKSVLERGFAVVRSAAGKPVHRAAAVPPGERLSIEFADGRVRASADGASKKAKAPAPAEQGTLFDASG
jgi:exodeoxyribonuclease VII large subunit